MYLFSIKKYKTFISLLIVIIIGNAFIYFVGYINNYLEFRLFLANFHLIFIIMITAYSPAYSLTIDTEKRSIQIKYRFLYFIEKQLVVSFEEFDYAYGYGPGFISLGGYEISFYLKKYSIVTLNTKFGWKKKVLKEIINVLEENKTPIKRFLDRKNYTKRAVTKQDDIL